MGKNCEGGPYVTVLRHFVNARRTLLQLTAALIPSNMISAVSTHIPSVASYYVPQFNSSHTNAGGDYITNTTSNIPGYNESVSILNIGQANPVTTCRNIPSSVSYDNPYNAASFEAYQAYLNARIGFNTPMHHPNFSTSGLLTKSISANPVTTVVSNVGSQPITSLSSANTSGGATTPAPSSKITIENSCLAYIQSQLYRLNQAEVISQTSTHFGLDEIKGARESLFRSTGTRTYKYIGPNDPSTQSQKSNHCCAGILSKMNEVSKKGIILNCVASSEELFRLAKILVNAGSSGMSADNKDTIQDHERRIREIENDMKSLKTQSNLNKAAPQIPNPVIGENRLNFLKALGSPSAFSSPSKKRRTFEFGAKSTRPSSPLVSGNMGINSGPNNPSSPAWQTVKSKSRKRNKPEVDHIPKGLPPKAPQNALQLFLFRYQSDETPASVLKYFKDIGVTSAFHVRYCCHVDSASKNFVLRFRNEDEFPIILRGLPEFTGCRWYSPEAPSANEERPLGWFNSGGKIRGPHVEAILGDQQDSTMDTSVAIVSESDPSDNLPIVSSASSLMQQSNANSSTSQAPSTNAWTQNSLTPAEAPTVLTNPGTSDVNATTSTNPGTSDVNVTTSTNPTAASSPTNSGNPTLKGITPLVDSPHLKTDNVGYEKVIRDSDKDSK